MAVVSGFVLFDSLRMADPSSITTGIANVPVALQNTVTNEMLTVLTNADGGFMFTNVPNGSFRVVEAYHTPGVFTPGDFAQAQVEDIPHAVFPPISYVTSPPAGATNLDCTTPNTLLITVADADIMGLYILNAPVIYTPITNSLDPSAVIDPHNLLTDAVSGTMGTFPAGTPANTGVPTEPFPANVPDYDYVLPLAPPGSHSPEAQQYTVQNIMNADSANYYQGTGNWWRVADRTTGNETGRMMVVNGDIPGSCFFESTVNVTPNTHYLFSTWILNMMKRTGFADPALGVEVLDPMGARIYAQTLGAQIPVNTLVPEWKQAGAIIFSGEYTSITVRFLSEGPEDVGNDYAIDNIALQEIHIPIFTPRKSSSVGRMFVGDTATYTITLKNTSGRTLTNVVFRDMVPDGLAFVEGSVTINGVPEPDADPEVGFVVPDIAGDSSAVVTFDVTAISVPDTNPAKNQAYMSYKYALSTDTPPVDFNVPSNEVMLRINPAPCEFVSIALQRERNVPEEIAQGGIMTFDAPIYSKGPIYEQPDGTIEIRRAGTYIAAWFAAGMAGRATNGQLYKIKRLNHETSAWVDITGANSHIKNSAITGFAVINITDADISEYGRCTIALFNCADADAMLTFFNPKAGIIVYGANFGCVDSRMISINNNMADIMARIQKIEHYLHMSEVTEILSLTPELAGLGAAVIYIGYNYNFWGIGTLIEDVILSEGESYYLIKSDQYEPLTYYQGDPTIGTVWIETPGMSAKKYPLHFDSSGIYLIPEDDLSLSAGAKFSFTRGLILVNSNE